MAGRENQYMGNYNRSRLILRATFLKQTSLYKPHTGGKYSVGYQDSTSGEIWIGHTKQKSAEYLENDKISISHFLMLFHKISIQSVLLPRQHGLLSISEVFWILYFTYNKQVVRKTQHSSA